MPKLFINNLINILYFVKIHIIYMCRGLSTIISMMSFDDCSMESSLTPTQKRRAKVAGGSVFCLICFIMAIAIHGWIRVGDDVEFGIFQFRKLYLTLGLVQANRSVYEHILGLF